MKGGLQRIPSEKFLEAAYLALLHLQTRHPTLPELSLYTQWARFDPRLAEILVGYLAQNWKRINPLEFRAFIFAEPWPAVVAVLLVFSRRLLEKQTDQETVSLFDHWTGLITVGIEKAPGEQFFIGLRQLGGIGMWEDALYASDEYRKWGYLARENLLPKGQGVELSAATRVEVLKALLLSSKRIRTTEYWNALGKCISFRQAERDLQKSEFLHASGNTKGRYYYKK